MHTHGIYHVNLVFLIIQREGQPSCAFTHGHRLCTCVEIEWVSRKTDHFASDAMSENISKKFIEKKSEIFCTSQNTRELEHRSNFESCSNIDTYLVGMNIWKYWRKLTVLAGWSKLIFQLGVTSPNQIKTRASPNERARLGKADKE